jgi:hypothetical protein
MYSPILRFPLQAIVVALALAAFGACESPPQEGGESDVALPLDMEFDSVVVPMVRYDPATSAIDTIKGIPEGVLVVEGVWNRDSTLLVLGTRQGAYICDVATDSCRAVEGVSQETSTRISAFRNGKMLIVATGNGANVSASFMFDPDNCRLRRIINGDDDFVTGAIPNPERSAMVVSVNKTHAYWVTENDSVERIATPGDGFTTYLGEFGWNRDASVLLVESPHGLSRFDRDDRRITHIQGSGLTSIAKIVVAPDGEKAYVGLRRTEWRNPDIKTAFLRYDYKTGVLEQVEGGPPGAFAIEMMDSGYVLVAGDDALYRYSDAVGRAQVVPSSRGLKISQVDRLSTKRALVSVGMKDTYSYNIEDGALRLITTIPAGYVSALPLDSLNVYLGSNAAALRYDALRGGV